MKISKGLSGVAGEYFVAAELSRRGYIASITLRNTRAFDILVTNAHATRSVGIQVKTNQNSKKDWVLTEKAECLESEQLFYVFVNLNGLDMLPTYHVVPSKVVADHCKTGHANWLQTPGKLGQQRRDNSMRKYDDRHDVYLSAWHLLSLDDPVPNDRITNIDYE